MFQVFPLNPISEYKVLRNKKFNLSTLDRPAAGGFICNANITVMELWSLGPRQGLKYPTGIPLMERQQGDHCLNYVS
jgi:hypothetical protein